MAQFSFGITPVIPLRHGPPSGFGPPFPFPNTGCSFGPASAFSPFPSQYFKDSSALACGSPDLQLISSNKVVFNVHKIYLSTASSLFHDMLDMTGDKGEEGIPKVEMSEDARTLDRLLALCYPGAPPHLVDCSQTELVQLMKAADKLAIARAVDVIGRALCRPSWLSASGIALYTLACQIDHSTLRQRAKASAAACPTLLSNATSHMSNMGATNFAVLLETAQRNKHILSPPEVYLHHMNLNKISTSGVPSRSDSLLFFDSINPDKLSAKVMANTML